MKQLTILLSLLLCFTVSCNRVKNKTKDVINKGGEAVGKGATEFVEGVSEGIDRTLDCELILSEELIDQGLKTGKFSIEDRTVGGENNRLTLYLIFEEDFDASLLVKAIDKKGLEVGRSRLPVQGKAGDAGYFDFPFDKRTYIEVKSKITIE
ncbi:MAG: hypothetical protein HEP71_30670 [Roseivirga sp.]|nr:hypothetical protein [Roseivirga sp.]